VPECKLRLFIFKEKYDSPLAGHKDEKSRYSSIIKVVLAAPKGGYSPLCEILGGCRVNRTSYQKQSGLLRPLPIPPGPWHCICMDFITSLPEPQEYDAILVMVVRFAKLAHMVPIVGTATALETT